MISAFTQGNIDTNIYIKQPLGHIDPKYPNSVLHLNKALYGLKQSARIWYYTLKEVFTKEVLKGWFNACKSLITELKIENYNTYNMDETRFSIRTMQSTRIIVDSTLRTRFQAYLGQQEWVSAVECICIDRTAIDPLIIFKGQNILQS